MQIEAIRQSKVTILNRVVINCSSLGLPLSNITSKLPYIATKYGADFKLLVEAVKNNNIKLLGFFGYEKSVISFLDLETIEREFVSRRSELKLTLETLIKEKKDKRRRKKKNENR